MLPKKSNTLSQGCTPTSSNCVVWQGPDLSCINLCAGDTVTEVVHKLATELCTIKNSLGVDLTDVDFDCLLNTASSADNAELTLAESLNLIISKTCLNSSDIAYLKDSIDATVTIPGCLNLRDGGGDPITNLPIEDFTLILAQRLCAIIDDIQDLQTASVTQSIQIDDITGRVIRLETNGKLKVIPVCTGPNVLTDIDDAFQSLEEDFCNVKTSLGTSTELISVISNECQGEGAGNIVRKLVDKNQALWSGSSQNISDTLSRMWLAICDLRGAVSLIQETCCTVGCDDIQIDFSVKLYNDGATMRLFFGGRTSVPDSFYDCNPLGSPLTITDALGNQQTFYIKLREDVLNVPNVLTSGYEIDLFNSPIDPAQPLEIVMLACMTDGNVSCSKCVTNTYTLPKTNVYCEFVATGTGTATIVYE